MEHRIQIDDAHLDLDQALESEGLLGAQKRGSHGLAVFQRPEDCLDRKSVIRWGEKYQKQDEEEEIGMVVEVQLIGEEDISLEYEKRATGKTAEEP